MSSERHPQPDSPAPAQPENGFETNPRYDAYMRYCDALGRRASLREFVTWVNFYGNEFRRKNKLDAYTPIGGMQEFTAYLHGVADAAWPHEATERTEKILRAVTHYRIEQYGFAERDSTRTPEAWACLMAKQFGQFANAATFSNRDTRRAAALSLAALCVAYVECDDASTETKDLGLGVVADSSGDLHAVHLEIEAADAMLAARKSGGAQ